MASLAPTNFGPLIAYVIPGGGMLYCLRPVSADIDKWFGTVGTQTPTIAGFLFVTLAAVATGLMLSTIRWLALDTLHHRTGIDRPSLSMRNLASATDAFRLLVENKYQYYQFYGNSLTAILLATPVLVSQFGVNLQMLSLLLVASVLLYLGSRDTLKGYYSESSRLLGVDLPSRPAEASKSDTEIP